MLQRPFRMSASDVRFLFRQKIQKIHAQHLSAHVFFLPEPGLPRFAPMLPKGSYKNSVDMHRRRRIVYAALAPTLADRQKHGRLWPALFCALRPKDSFFALTLAEREATMAELLDKIPTTLPS